MPAIEVVDLRKVYSHRLLRFAATAGRLLRATPISLSALRGRARVEALRGVSFTIEPGEVVGLIGANGAGKSTLLRILSGLARPSAGAVRVQGRVTAILDIHTGLVPEHTGRENIAYLGRLYGLSAERLRAKTDEIIAFADIGAFIDMPVRSYSMGMRARLAFSVVTSVDPEVLLIDEALSVGDSGFELRCRKRMHALCARGSTVVMVSHILPSLRALCERVLWLSDGQLARDGDPQEVIAAYRASRKTDELLARGGVTLGPEPSDGPVAIEAVGSEGEGGPSQRFLSGEPLRVRLVVQSAEAREVEARLLLEREDGVIVSRSRPATVPLSAGQNEVVVELGPQRLGPWTFLADVELRDPAGERLTGAKTAFTVEDYDHAYRSSYFQPISWREAEA